MLLRQSYKAFALLAILLLLGTGLFVGGSTSVRAATCEPRDVYVSGGEAHWTKCRNPGSVQVVGWVKDTRADGMCAQVYANFNNGQTRFSDRACPKGTIREFNWSEPASNASVFLRTI